LSSIYELEVMDVVFVFLCEIRAGFNVEQRNIHGIHGQHDIQDTKTNSKQRKPRNLSFSHHDVLVDQVSELDIKAHKE